jgi:transcriptional regulator with XRE-family HTH domain
MGLLKRFPRMSMLTIGERLRAYRESKAISQKEMQKRLGLSRCYISRIENGHSIPKLETLKRFADASEVLLFHLVYEDGDLRPPRFFHERRSRLSKDQVRALEEFSRAFAKVGKRDRELLISLAKRMRRSENGAKQNDRDS